MSLCTKLFKAFSFVERNVILFFVRRAGVWANILNKEVNEEVEAYHLDMIRTVQDAGNSWDHEKMSPMVDEMRKFRAENIKFAFGHVLAALAIVLSLTAIVISILK